MLAQKWAWANNDDRSDMLVVILWKRNLHSWLLISPLAVIAAYFNFELNNNAISFSINYKLMTCTGVAVRLSVVVVIRLTRFVVVVVFNAVVGCLVVFNVVVAAAWHSYSHAIIKFYCCGSWFIFRKIYDLFVFEQFL